MHKAALKTSAHEAARFTAREAVRGLFRKRFGAEALIVRAPGRINIIGDHTDYNGGLALCAAVDRAVWIAAKRNDLGRVRIEAPHLNKRYDDTLGRIASGAGPWPRYLLGVVEILREAGAAIGGFDLVYDSDIPLGSGLSSSSALSCGLAFALGELYDLRLERERLVEIARLAEERYVGTQSGSMDQTTILFGKRNHALLLDFRSRTRNPIAFPLNARIILCDSGVERAAVEDRYNERRAECVASVHILRKYNPKIRTLRDLSDADLAEHAGEMGPTLSRRCRFVLAEDDRVARSALALLRGDVLTLGRLMFESHEGLRAEYQVSVRDVDRLVTQAATIHGVLGARIMGTGFGGCTINLVREEALEEFMATMGTFYHDVLARPARMFACELRAGVQRVA